MAKKSSKSKSKKTGSLFSAGVIILALLIIFIIFLFNKDQILTNFKDTDFFGRVFGSTPEFVQNHESTSDKEKIQLKDDVVTIKVEPEKPAPKKEEKPVIPEEPAKKASEQPVKKEAPAKQTSKPQEQPAVAVKPATMDLQLCFVSIDADGMVVRKNVKRSVSKSDSPLTTSINLLLKGPDFSLKDEKYVTTLIPEQSRLLSARVENGVAYLNFNDAFEINNEGSIGFQNQLMQVVYTATSFSTVKSVQFLIEGKKKDYLGSEGIWIGSPLSRNSF